MPSKTKAAPSKNGAAPSTNGTAPEVEAVVASSAPPIAISRLAEETMLVPIIGTTELIVHNFSEKSKRAMLDAMQGRRSPKEPKDPQSEYEAAFYRRSDGTPGFPSNGFKLATVSASRFYGRDVTATALRQFFFIFGTGENPGDRALVEIEGEPYQREDVVRVGRGGTDLRYRPGFVEWRTTLAVVFISSVLTRDSVLSLIDAGGMGVGVGEWRPERDGVHGTYRVDTDRDIQVVS